jgi:hypothetical protein
MALVYPGLVNIDNSTISVNTINVYDESDPIVTEDLSAQIPEFDAPEAKWYFDLIHPVKPGTMILTLDGLVLSPYDPNTQQGDYRLSSSIQVEILWTEGVQKQSSDDTPVLLARFTAQGVN